MFRWNCQAVSDWWGPIFDIYIIYGVTSVDCLANKASDLYT